MKGDEYILSLFLFHAGAGSRMENVPSTYPLFRFLGRRNGEETGMSTFCLVSFTPGPVLGEKKRGEVEEKGMSTFCLVLFLFHAGAGSRMVKCTYQDDPFMTSECGGGH
jgi:hypothetical protein